MPDAVGTVGQSLYDPVTLTDHTVLFQEYFLLYRDICGSITSVIEIRKH